MLKFIAISGTTGVTENHYIYECGNDLIVVDCGVGFPDPEMYGVDLVIPDFTYVRENKSKLRAIFISHGHEDHLGALPFLLNEVDVPVYATKLTAGFIEEKFTDYNIKPQKIKIIDPERDVISAGAFKVTPFRVSHSVQDAVGFAIDTPEGKVFHVPDYKFDWNPVDKRPFDVAKAAMLASGGALAVASDALGSTTSGYTESEREIEVKLFNIAEKAKGKILFTTISSNISRVKQALDVAERLGRKVSFIGKSIGRKSEIATELGYLEFPSDLVVPPKKLTGLPQNKIMYIVSGSYGQSGSALDRISLGEHELISIKEGDMVIFSGDPAPPGSKAKVDAVVDRLFELNAEVHYYDTQEDLHVSGHGSQEDIKMLFALLKPKYFIPIGGTTRHMRAYNKLAQGMGSSPENVFELKQGDIVEFSSGEARKAGRIPVKSVLVDGLGIGDVGNVVLRDRQTLAKDGVAITMIKLDRNEGQLVSDPEIISRGFVYEAKDKNLLLTAASELKNDLQRRHKRLDVTLCKDGTINFLERYFYDKTGRRPMVLPVVVEV